MKMTPKNSNPKSQRSSRDSARGVRDTQGSVNRKLFFEHVEDRCLLATLTDTDALANIATVEDISRDVRVRLGTTDINGQAAESVAKDETFLLNVYVQDLRDTPEGVLSAFVDVTFDADFAKPVGTATFGEHFEGLRTQGGYQPGLLDDFGAFSDMEAMGSDEFLLFQMPFRATNTGDLKFQVSHNSDTIGQDILVVGNDNALDVSRVEFLPTTLNVFESGSALDRSEETALLSNSLLSSDGYSPSQVFITNRPATVRDDFGDSLNTKLRISLNDFGIESSLLSDSMSTAIESDTPTNLQSQRESAENRFDFTRQAFDQVIDAALVQLLQSSPADEANPAIESTTVLQSRVAHLDQESQNSADRWKAEIRRMLKDFETDRTCEAVDNDTNEDSPSLIGNAKFESLKARISVIPMTSNDPERTSDQLASYDAEASWIDVNQLTHTSTPSHEQATATETTPEVKPATPYHLVQSRAIAFDFEENDGLNNIAAAEEIADASTQPESADTKQASTAKPSDSQTTDDATASVTVQDLDDASVHNSYLLPLVVSIGIARTVSNRKKTDEEAVAE